MAKLSKQERHELARKRILSVLRRHTIATARILEQKISDAGPTDQRIDPHVLTTAKAELLREGAVRRKDAAYGPWFHLAATEPAVLKERLDLLTSISATIQKKDFLLRVGQSLEIAVYRALLGQSEFSILGGFKDLHSHDDSTPYSREEPPSILHGRTTDGKLDFIALSAPPFIAGIEVKNLREWQYPDREEVQKLLKKCCDLRVVPVLIARRIPFVTFKVLNACGVIIHQTYNQLYPDADSVIASRAKDKDLLGFHDIRTGNTPDQRLIRFCTVNLTPLIHSMQPRFEEYRDLLEGFATKAMPYAEFAGRVRRRAAGLNEDHDWDESSEGSE